MYQTVLSVKKMKNNLHKKKNYYIMPKKKNLKNHLVKI